MRSKTRESSKGTTTTISIDKRKANIEKSNESDLRNVADQDWEYVISGHGLVGRCPSRVIRHSHKRLIQRPVAGTTRRQCPKASRRLLRNCCCFFFFFFSLSLCLSLSLHHHWQPEGRARWAAAAAAAATEESSDQESRSTKQTCQVCNYNY